MECLTVAGREQLVASSRARYTATFPSIGTFTCEFVWRGRTVDLRLRRQPAAFEMVEPTRRVTLALSLRRRRPTHRCSGRATNRRAAERKR